MTYFKQKEAIRTEIKEIKHLKELTHEDSKSDAHVMELQAQYKEIEQRQDANYELLRAWNKIWLALLSKGEFQGKITGYQEIIYNARFVELEKSIQSPREQVDNLVQETSVQSPRENLNNAARGKIDQHEKLAELEEELQEKRIEREHDMARNRFFLNTLSSEYVAVALERYILPLLYGLLGAIFFVLRTLSKEVRDLTYFPLTEINYRLRIPTGALAGLTVNWFFTGSTLSSGLSGFAISLLTGYNVEVLFFLMDKIISQFTGKDSGSEHALSQSQAVSREMPARSLSRLKRNR